MAAIFCCSSISPYRPRRLDHEAKFTSFMRWAGLETPSLVSVDGSLVNSAPYAVQLVRQINYGPQESIRYFVPASDGSDFAETTEDDLLKSNFEKLNSYKNFRCEKHNRFFETNLYQKSPTNTHHWRANLARPSRTIDLAFQHKDPEINSSNKVEEPAGQKEKQELLSSDVQGQASFPELRTSFSQALQEADEAVSQKTQPLDKPDITTLKSFLRSLLPTVGTSLGTSRLLTLLSLDWANAELNLGLDFESLWKNELTSSNVLLFFRDCILSFDTASLHGVVDLEDTELLVIRAMYHVDSRDGQPLVGKVRFHEIVNKVLESGCELDWVSVHGGNIARVFTSGPGDLLDGCQREKDGFERDQSRQLEVDDNPSEKVNVRPMPMMGRDRELYDYDDFGYDDRDSDYDREPDKDFTACDQECGYCGNCDY